MDKVNEIVVYQPDEIVNLEVRVENESVWLTQQQMSVLFHRDRTVITRHINHVFSERELEEKSNVQILHFANSDKPIKFYSFDVIISVGYRVKSQDSFLSLPNSAPIHCLLSREMFCLLMSFGHSASQAYVLVQLPKPSSSILATMFFARSAAST